MKIQGGDEVLIGCSWLIFFYPAPTNNGRASAETNTGLERLIGRSKSICLFFISSCSWVFSDYCTVMSPLDNFSCFPKHILSLCFFIAARGNPRYQIPEHLLNEMNAANTELQKKRYIGVTELKQLLSAGLPRDSEGKKFLEQSQNWNGSISEVNWRI